MVVEEKGKLKWLKVKARQRFLKTGDVNSRDGTNREVEDTQEKND